MRTTLHEITETTLEQGSVDQYSIAVFPFLKTEAPIGLGGLVFRSTDDVADLPPHHADSVREIAEMLYLRDDLRIQRATYAVVPFLDLTFSVSDVPVLTDVQAVVAYLYGGPARGGGSPFLSSEHAVMVVFTPGEVWPSLVRTSPNATRPGGTAVQEHDGPRGVPGYAGLYGFRQIFWVEPGSRVYGPMPRLELNQSQDLSQDIPRAASKRLGVRYLLDLLGAAPTSSSSRVLTAIRWYNEANRASNSEEAALVNLAIAFESLFGLPSGDKTDRLIDSIALLLGRVPRLDEWAHQFYAARSSVVHEGRAQYSHFIARDYRAKSGGSAYQPLWVYGIQVFRLCLVTLLVGADLAREAGLEEKLVTNQERFERVCGILDEPGRSAADRLADIEPLVDSLERNRFLSEGGLRLDTMIGAVRRALSCLIEADETMLEGNKASFSGRIKQLESSDEFTQLSGVRRLSEAFPTAAEPACAQVHDLVEVVWHYAFMHYFWLERRRNSEDVQTL